MKQIIQMTPGFVPSQILSVIENPTWNRKHGGRKQNSWALPMRDENSDGHASKRWMESLVETTSCLEFIR